MVGRILVIGPIDTGSSTGSNYDRPGLDQVKDPLPDIETYCPLNLIVFYQKIGYQNPVKHPGSCFQGLIGYDGF